MARRGSTQDKPQARSDAYVGLLFIALLAQIAAAVFFWLDYNAFPKNKPDDPRSISAPAPTPAGGGGAGAAGAGGQPPMGGGGPPMGGGGPPMGGGGDVIK